MIDWNNTLNYFNKNEKGWMNILIMLDCFGTFIILSGSSDWTKLYLPAIWFLFLSNIF